MPPGQGAGAGGQLVRQALGAAGAGQGAAGWRQQGGSSRSSRRRRRRRSSSSSSASPTALAPPPRPPRTHDQDPHRRQLAEERARGDEGERDKQKHVAALQRHRAPVEVFWWFTGGGGTGRREVSGTSGRVWGGSSREGTSRRAAPTAAAAAAVLQQLQCRRTRHIHALAVADVGQQADGGLPQERVVGKVKVAAWGRQGRAAEAGRLTAVGRRPWVVQRHARRQARRCTVKRQATAALRCSPSSSCSKRFGSRRGGGTWRGR